MTQTSPTVLHELPASLDVLAMAVAAAFAAHAARERRVPLFGVLLAGLVGGLGGGMLRDVRLGLEPAAITIWYYVPVVLASAVIGALSVRKVHFSRLPFVAAQGVAIGLLIGIGVQKAVEYRTPAPAAILLGVITGTFGGVFDDLLTGRRAVVMADDHWLLGVVALGAAVFWALTIYVAFYAAVVATVVIVSSLRVLSVHLGWTSPVFPGDDLAPLT